MEKFLLVVVIFGIGAFGLIFGGMFLFADSYSIELASDIASTPLEKTSCEKMYNIKHNLSNIDVMFYNEDRVIKQVEIKWEGMKCDNKDLEYWKGTDWNWSDSVENKIKEFEK